MVEIMKALGVLIVLSLPTSASLAATAGSRAAAAPKPLSADLAKMCRALAIKAHPTQPPGSKAGSERAQRDYYYECVAKDGDMQK